MKCKGMAETLDKNLIVFEAQVDGLMTSLRNCCIVEFQTRAKVHFVGGFDQPKFTSVP
jgi:hypothetical protein